jgi:hypothetical protein
MKKLLLILSLFMLLLMQSCVVVYHGHRWHRYHDVYYVR